MSVETIKDLHRCKAFTKIQTLSDRHFYRVYLWRTKYSFLKFVNEEGCIGLHRPMQWYEDESGEISTHPMLGDIHFVSNNWDEEVVSHECTHALFHFQRVQELFETDDMSIEEQLCYFQGDLMQKVYKWLWNIEMVTQ